MKKRVIRSMCSLLAVIILIAPVGAMAFDTDQRFVGQWSIADADYEVVVEEAKNYAYMDIDTAPLELSEKILESRNTIIFSESWCTEGFEMWIMRANGDIEFLPYFSELFPNWDIPVLPTEDLEIAESRDTRLENNIQFRGLSTFTTSITAPSNTEITEPFFFASGFSVLAGPTAFSKSKHCNLGVTRLSNGASLAHATYMYVDDVMGWQDPHYVSTDYGIRASTYSTPGTATIQIAY